MSKRAVLIAQLALLLPCSIAIAVPLPVGALAQGPFWVSSAGNDSTGDGSQANPWRQVQRAIDYIRTNKLNQAAGQDIVVNVHAGSYAPIKYGQLDSGFNGHVVHYLSVDGPGQAVIDAGQQITNWTLVTGSTYKAPVPNTFYTMYENDIRSTVARIPKLSPAVGFPSSRTPYFITQTDGNSLTELIYNSADFNPAAWSTADAQIVSWPGGLWEWLTEQDPISTINTSTKVITFVNNAKFNLYQNSLGSRYFVQGDQSMQSAPGEWYLDRVGMMLYYIARDGPIASQTIVIPTATEAVTFYGKSGKPGDRVSYVTFDGFAVQHTDFVQWYRPGWPVPVSGTVNGPVPNPWVTGSFYAWLAVMPQNALGAVHLRNTDHITITNVHVKNAGMYGVFLDGYGQQDQILNSWLEQVGCSGIRLDGPFPGLGDVLNNDTIQNFRINDVGQLSGTGSGIDIAQSGSNLIKFGKIFNGPRKGIWVLATTGQTDVSTIYARNNLVDHVKLQFLGQDSGDMGALGIDSLSSISPSLVQNTAQQMIIDSISANTSLRDAVPDGILLDDQTDGQILTDIQVTNVAGQQLRTNSTDHSIDHVLTNCSFQSDGTVNPSFNPALMDTANIGTTSAFPYP
jgi:hypothetical protein